MNTTIYGIPNCDTCKKALKWLTQQSIEHTFFNVRTDNLSQEHITHWLKTIPVEKLVNKRSTTWKQLDDTQRAEALSDPSHVLLAFPTLIKRPVIESDGKVAIGFKPADYAAFFSLEE